MRVMLLLSPTSYRAPAFLAAARQLGIEAVKVVDAPRGVSGPASAALALDFQDGAGSAQAIADYAAEHPVRAVVAIDDEGTLIAARANALLGLPYNAPEAALAARDKHLMREMLARGGVPAPESRRVDLEADPAAEAARTAYPCVLKPRALSGSRGVIRADNPAEFMRAFARVRAILACAGGDSLLVERFVPGFEVALEGLLVPGAGGQSDLRVLALFDKPDPLDGPYFEETIYVTPSRLPAATQAAIADCTARATAALGLRQGPVHAELRVNDAGPWLIEVAGRSIGGLCSRTLRFGTDMSLEELILRQAVGLPIDDFTRAGEARGVMMIPIPGEGLLTGVDGLDAARAVPGVESIEITAALNRPILPLPEGESYLGFIFARGATPAEAERALRTAHTKLQVRLEPIIHLST